MEQILTIPLIVAGGLMISLPIGMLLFEMTCLDKFSVKSCVRSSIPKMLYIFVSFQQFSRILVLVLPQIFWESMRESKNGLAFINILELVPELFFILSYSLVLFSWIELYHMTKAMKVIDKNHCLKFPFVGTLLCTTILIGLTFLFSFMIAFSPDSMLNNYNDISLFQTLFVCFMSFLAVVGFVIYFFLIRSLFRETDLKNSSALRLQLNKNTIICTVFCAFLSIRVGFLMFLNWGMRFLLAQGALTDFVFHLGSFFYIFALEQCALFLVVGITFFFQILAKKATEQAIRENLLSKNTIWLSSYFKKSQKKATRRHHGKSSTRRSGSRQNPARGPHVNQNPMSESLSNGISLQSQKNLTVEETISIRDKEKQRVLAPILPKNKRKTHNNIVSKLNFLTSVAEDEFDDPPPTRNQQTTDYNDEEVENQNLLMNQRYHGGNNNNNYDYNNNRGYQDHGIPGGMASYYNNEDSVAFSEESEKPNYLMLDDSESEVSGV